VSEQSQIPITEEPLRFSVQYREKVFVTLEKTIAIPKIKLSVTMPTESILLINYFKMH